MALVDQMMRASRLDIALYEEVERDTTQTNNALMVVVITSLATGIGAAIGAMMDPEAGGAGVAIMGLIGGILAALASWVVWSGAVYFVGTRLFKGTATWGEVLRTVGFANSPGVLRILGFIPVLGGVINLVVGIWVIVTTVVAVRQALDIGTGAAIVASIIGAILAAIVLGIVAAIFAVPFLAMGAMTPP